MKVGKSAMIQNIFFKNTFRWPITDSLGTQYGHIGFQDQITIVNWSAEYLTYANNQIIEVKSNVL